MISFDLEKADLDKEKEFDPAMLDRLDGYIVNGALYRRENPNKPVPKHICLAEKKLDVYKRKMEASNVGRDEYQPRDTQVGLAAPSPDRTSEVVQQIIEFDIHGGLDFLWKSRVKDPRCGLTT